MKVYKVEDLENFERDAYGRLIYPSGDYTQIESFDNWCSFGEGSRFGEHCNFGNCCSFGKWCSFGKCCSFGEVCNFAEGNSFGECCDFRKCCSFGDWCSFGEKNNFDERCSFGKYCNFRKWCNFDERCKFGEGCNLDNNLTFENIQEQIKRVLKIDRIGSRKGCTYFFKTPSKIYVRCGCFFGTLKEFKKAVLKTHKNNEQYRKEYLETIKYVKAIL